MATDHQSTMQNNKSLPKPSPDDTPKMREAIERLSSMGIRFTRPSLYQLKIGDLSFYPSKGTIFRDSDPAGWERRGLEALVAYLEAQIRRTNATTVTTQQVLHLNILDDEM